jgi:shikimate kinase
LDSKNIVLIGFMGTGKTSVGKMIAQRLKRPLIDVDKHIETVEKRKIADIFAQEGEAYFRSIETKAIAEFSTLRGVVITTGGGSVLNPKNLEALRRGGWLVALRASPETIYERVKDSPHRPLLLIPDRLSEIRRLLEVRSPVYQKADFSFCTDDKTPSETTAEILAAIEQKTGPAACP